MAQINIFEYNGGCVFGMLGKDCVGFATDHRFGFKAQTIDVDFLKIYQISNRIFLGLPGLQSDSISVYEKIKFRKSIVDCRNISDMDIEDFTSMLSSFLYEYRFGPFFVQPVIAGIDKDDEPYLCNMDLIGYTMKRNNYVAVGSCEEQLYGMSESLWKEDLGKEELFQVMSQCLLSAFERDCLSGWGATVYIIDKDSVEEKKIQTRMD